MSTTTVTAPIDAVPSALAAAKQLRDKAASAAAKPLALARKILSALAGGWREHFGFVRHALSTVPKTVVAAAATAVFSTEGGYEKVRNAAHWAAKGFGRLVSWVTGKISLVAMAAAAGITNIVGRINETAGRLLFKAFDTTFTVVGKAAAFVGKTYNATVDGVFCALGHRTAVTIVTTGATGMTVLLAAEAVSTVAVNYGIIPTTVSGLVAGTPVLAGVPLLPALFTGFAAVGVVLAALVVTGGVTAWLLNRSEVTDMIEADAEFTNAPAEEIEDEVYQAEVEQILTQAEEFKVQEQVAKAILREAKAGKKHHK